MKKKIERWTGDPTYQIRAFWGKIYNDCNLMYNSVHQKRGENATVHSKQGKVTAHCNKRKGVSIEDLSAAPEGWDVMCKWKQVALTQGDNFCGRGWMVVSEEQEEGLLSIWQHSPAFPEFSRRVGGLHFRGGRDPPLSDRVTSWLATAHNRLPWHPALADCHRSLQVYPKTLLSLGFQCSNKGCRFSHRFSTAGL